MVTKVIKFFYRKLKNLIYGFFWYFRDLVAYKKLLQSTGQAPTFKYFPQIFDKDPSSHTFDKHYVYMDRWAFKKIQNNQPAEHIDVGSSIRFLSMASSVTKLKFVDIRPVKIDFDNYECLEGSILQMPFSDNSVESLSCLHVAEHIGLGRYGDPLDPLGTIKACKELVRILKPQGKLYFALPIGKNAVYFNAHRVHNPEVILDYFKDLNLISFSAVGDDGHFIESAKLEDFKNANYACGMFEFTK
jgi:SAM-dependent methyltransferase